MVAEAPVADDCDCVFMQDMQLKNLKAKFDVLDWLDP